VWPWLLGHYAEGYLKIYGKEGMPHIQAIYDGLEETIFEHGVGSVSEVYSGDPPHKAGGAISQAWSVAEIIRIKSMLDQLQQSGKAL
jgi:glycogen debranching enzyme